MYVPICLLSNIRYSCVKNAQGVYFSQKILNLVLEGHDQLRRAVAQINYIDLLLAIINLIVTKYLIQTIRIFI